MTARLKLDDQLCFALYAATNAVTGAYRPLLGELGLTYPQYLVLMVLWDRGEMPVTELARHLQMPVDAVSPLVRRLERAGLVDRWRSSSDRRVVTVSLTDTGADLHDSASEAQASVVCRTGLEPDSLDELRDTLHALVRRMSVRPVMVPADDAQDAAEQGPAHGETS
jgi:DNA-binding MarR family transcriptional regulator